MVFRTFALFSLFSWVAVANPLALRDLSSSIDDLRFTADSITRDSAVFWQQPLAASANVSLRIWIDVSLQSLIPSFRLFSMMLLPSIPRYKLHSPKFLYAFFPLSSISSCESSQISRLQSCLKKMPIAHTVHSWTSTTILKTASTLFPSLQPTLYHSGSSRRSVA